MRKIIIMACLLAIAGLSSWQVMAVPVAAGKIVLVTGKASALSPDGKARKIKRGGPFYEGDTIETTKKSFVKLKYTDGGVMLLRPGTKIVVEKYKDPKVGQGESVTKLVKGGMRAVTGAIAKKSRKKYKLRTPSATMGVRGTDYTVRYCRGDCADLSNYGAPAPTDGLYTGVSSGGITLTNASGTRLFKVGQYGYVSTSTSGIGLLPGAPAILAVDNLPDPTDNNGKDFISGNACQ